MNEGQGTPEPISCFAPVLTFQITGGVHVRSRVLQVDSMAVPAAVQTWAGVQEEGVCVDCPQAHQGKCL